jgi:broad specificity phosphatase PhoE
VSGGRRPARSRASSSRHPPAPAATPPAEPGSAPVSRLILVRHAETEWNEAGRYQGWEDPPLSARGHRTAARLARLIEDRAPAVEELWSSDLQRAVHTGRLAFGREPRADKRLRELDFGAFSGQTWEENELCFGARFLDWVRRPDGEAPPHGGECLADFEARVLEWCEEVVGRAAAPALGAPTPRGSVDGGRGALGERPRGPSPRGRTAASTQPHLPRDRWVAVVTHGGVIQTLVRSLAGVELRAANGDVFVLAWNADDGPAELERWGRSPRGIATP